MNNLKKAALVLWAGVIGYFLLFGYALNSGSTVLLILLGIVGLVLCGYGIYLSTTKNDNNSTYLSAIQNQLQNEYRSAIAPFYEDMQRNYYNLFSKLQIPTDVAKIDVETTVFGLQCLAIPTAGQTAFYQNDFYIWKDNATLFIFPTEVHLTLSHISYRTKARDLPTKINTNDITLFKIGISDIEYYLITGQETSELKIGGGGSNGPNIKGAIVGGILAGEAGAIIGGMPEQKPVYSHTKHNEGRCVELVYKKNGRVEKIRLSYPAFSFLERWMPEKDYSYVIFNSRVNNG